MRNVEVKLECRDARLARALCASLGATFAGTLEQTDTYFRVPRGRLKRRQGPDEPVEYIEYDRADEARPRSSTCTIYSEEEALARFGRAPMPVWIIVRKRRDVYLLGNVRIHVDEVAGLGAFVEFEASVSRDMNDARCREAIAALRESLAPALGEAVAVGYADLLAAAEGEG